MKSFLRRPFTAKEGHLLFGNMDYIYLTCLSLVLFKTTTTTPTTPKYINEWHSFIKPIPLGCGMIEMICILQIYNNKSIIIIITPFL